MLVAVLINKRMICYLYIRPHLELDQSTLRSLEKAFPPHPHLHSAMSADTVPSRVYGVYLAILV